MIFHRLRIAAALIALSAGAFAQEETPRVPPEQKLTREQIAGAVRSETVSMPTPGELFAALGKLGKPNWQALFRQPIPTSYQSRPKGALNIGGLIADGYIAVEAQDSQQVKNVGRDVVSLAKTLGVSENVLRRGKSITEFAEANEWGALKEELEATQNEVRLAMEEQRDDQLVNLVTLGGWIRGIEVISSWIAENYTPEAARVLRQPAVIQFLRQRVESLPERTRDDPQVDSIREKLGELEALVSVPRGETPTIEQVKQLQQLSSDMVRDISAKK